MSANPPNATRLDSVDALRGLVMVLMALDHARGMISSSLVDATDLSKASAALFLTRWITHFCAPVFVFLAGSGAFFTLTRGKSKRELAKFLWTRGLWLIVLEATLVRFGWAFNFHYDLIAGQVIWAIGCSMIALAGLIFLPTPAVAGFGIVLIAAHNAFDGIKAAECGGWAWLWGILHGGYAIELAPGLKFVPVYPLVPWVGVMAAGYGFGALLNAPDRARKIAWLGASLIVTFILIRATNLYGDPRQWSAQKNALFTLFSFVNCTKYPPSLLYLLMTLGPALLLLAWWSRGFPMLAQPLVTFGRVPLFFYLLHLPLIHLAAVALSYPRLELGLGSFYFTRPPAESAYGQPLWVVYGVWVVVVAILFPLCRWFAAVKRRRKDWWLSYL